ncbi:FAD-dependent oxidoreductase [Pseudomonas putida]
MTIEKEQVVVVGAGVAGCTAALEAARNGLQVTLVDEHPQNTAIMSLDAPYFYGARLSSVLSDEGTVADRVLGSNDLLMDCLEAGVDVLTGTCAWGVFVPGQNTQSLGGAQVGLADGEKSWMLRYDHLVLATGARDLVLSFPGWELPGVLGVKAATTLLGKYQALEGNKVVVLGTGNVALQFAQQALLAGIEVIGIVDPSTSVQGDRTLAQALDDQQVPFYLGYTVQRALGTHQLTGAMLLPVQGGAELELACDTLCMAYGAVANIELASVAGCAMVYDAGHSGWAPRVDDCQETSVAGIYVVGDASGVTERALVFPELAMAQAQRAVGGILGKEGRPYDAPVADEIPQTSSSASYPPQQWLESLIQASGMQVMACQCEEVSRQALVDVSAPGYLQVSRGSPDDALGRLIAKGAASQDMHKRMTRAGMGHCQGRRCREHATMLIASGTGLQLSAVSPGSYRIPVRPLPIRVLAAHDEATALTEHWCDWLHDVELPRSDHSKHL